MDDEQLLARAAQGDHAAFELLVRRHAVALWRVARSIIANDAGAEEAVQNCLLSAFRGLSSYRAEASVRTWLLAICHRAALNQLRSARRPAAVAIDSIVSLASRAEQPELRMDLRRAVSDLPGNDRRAFVLVDVLGYSREEAAVIAGVPASTMRSRVARARHQLATALSELGSETLQGVLP